MSSPTPQWLDWTRTTALALLIVPASTANAAPTASEIAVRWINDLRRSERLGSLASYADLVDDASSHSRQMADRGEVYHHPRLAEVTSEYERLAQFEARARNLDQALRLALESIDHRQQVYGDYDRIGVGVTAAAGYVYVTWFFMKSRAP